MQTVAIQSHRDLIVWQKSMDLVVHAYELARQLPDFERHGITDQLRRSSVSVPANIAEGKGRSTAKDYAHFLGIARGSLLETETYITLIVRLNFVPASAASDALELCEAIGRMLTSMRNRVLASQHPSDKAPNRTP